MVVQEEYFDGPFTITELVFSRAPMGASSAVMEGFKVSMGEAAGHELGSEFALNLAPGSTLTPVIHGARVVAADNGTGLIVLPLETPYEYTGGNLLIDLSYSDINGSVYVWSWYSEGSTVLSANGISAETGYAHSSPPVIILRGE